MMSNPLMKSSPLFCRLWPRMTTWSMPPCCGWTWSTCWRTWRLVQPSGFKKRYPLIVATVRQSRHDHVVHKAPLPLQVGKKPGVSGFAEVLPSTQDSKNLDRRRWCLSLEQICERAGASAGVNDPSRCIGLAIAEADLLKQLKPAVSERSGRTWDTGKSSTSGQLLMVSEFTCPRSLHLKDQGCGPAVLPSFNYAVGWICKRLVPQYGRSSLQGSDRPGAPWEGQGAQRGCSIAAPAGAGAGGSGSEASPSGQDCRRDHGLAGPRFDLCIAQVWWRSSRCSLFPGDVGRCHARRCLADQRRAEEERHKICCAELPPFRNRMVEDWWGTFSAKDPWSDYIIHLGAQEWERVHSVPPHLLS